MFTLEKRFTFEAGHQLHHHKGKCNHPHGHSYILIISIRSSTISSSGSDKNMVIDFTEIKNIVLPMIKTYFDHKWLNDTLDTDSPTAEFIAQWIYNHLKPDFSLLWKVTLYETATSWVSYTQAN